MVVHILSQEKQPLLGRTLVSATVSFDAATPKKLDVRKEIAKSMKMTDEHVIIRHLYSGYGRQSARVEAVMYDNPADAAALENKKLLEKHTPVKKEEKPVSE